jgi:uncharacterized protein (TIGR02421 family)
MRTRDAIRPQDLAVDHELADTATSLRFLLDVTPVDLVETRRQFLHDGRPPSFTYGPLSDDLAVTAARLAAIPVTAVEDPALAHLLGAKHRELGLQLEMLSCRGDDRFRDLSEQLYGTVSPTLLTAAEDLLARVDPPRREAGPYLDAAAMAARAETELDHYRAVDRDVGTLVEIRSDSSGIMVVNGNVLIAPTARVSAARVDALLQHEIGTHVVTHVNGSRQPLRLLGAGLAGYDETQEGLAVLAEHLAGGLTPRRLRQLAARVVATHQMSEGATFPDVHRGLVDNGVRPIEAFTITMRVFRSGGLTKDAVYLRGLTHLLTYLGTGGVLDVLWLGKMALDDVPHIVDLRDRGELEAPLLQPRYLGAPGAQQRLAAIDAATTPLDLIGPWR